MIKDLEISQYLDFVITSKEVGYEKPNKEIFIAALKKGGVSEKGELALHIGDDLEKDIQGAANAGMKSILIHRNGSKVSNEGNPNLLFLLDLKK